MSFSKKKKVKLPSGTTISTAFATPIGPLVEQIFENVLKDYLKRYRCRITNRGRHISICSYVGTKLDVNSPLEMLFGQTIDTGEIIAIQVRDPLFDTPDEDVSSSFDPHPYTLLTFINVLCHEMVHAVQSLTGGKKRIRPPPHDPNCATESYFFNPHEMEARILGEYYAHVFGGVLLK